MKKICYNCTESTGGEGTLNAVIGHVYEKEENGLHRRTQYAILKTNIILR